jgi:hypothetical protein
LALVGFWWSPAQTRFRFRGDFAQETTKKELETVGRGKGEDGNIPGPSSRCWWGKIRGANGRAGECLALVLWSPAQNRFHFCFRDAFSFSPLPHKVAFSQKSRLPTLLLPKSATRLLCDPRPDG